MKPAPNFCAIFRALWKGLAFLGEAVALVIVGYLGVVLVIGIGELLRG